MQYYKYKLINAMQKNKDILSELLKKSGHINPSEDFTTSVMDKLKNNKIQVLAYQPLIPKSFWFYLIAFVLVIVTSIAFFPNSNSSEPSATLELSRTLIQFFSFPDIDLSIAPVIFIAVVGMWMLYFLDRIVSRHID